MAADEARHRLSRKLEQVLGREEAATLMEHLHPRRWDELATKADLEALAGITKADLEAHRSATQTDLDALGRALRGEMEAQGQALRGEIQGLRAWVGERFTAEREWIRERFTAEQRWTQERFEGLEHRVEAAEHRVLGSIRGEMSQLVTTQTRTIVFALVAALTANAGMVLAAVRLA